MKAYALLLPLLLLLSLLAGCTSSGDTTGAVTTEELPTPEATSAAETMENKAEAYADAILKPIVLNAFVCGDNCYLEYTPKMEGARTETALCSAPICDEWVATGELPQRLALKHATAKFGIGKQYNGGGEIMNDSFPDIVALELED